MVFFTLQCVRFKQPLCVTFSELKLESVGVRVYYSHQAGAKKNQRTREKKIGKKRSVVYSLIFFSRVDFIRSRLAFE